MGKQQTTTGQAGRLTAEQIAALTLAEAEAWTISVEGGDQIVQLRPGRPGRALILSLTTTTTNGPTTAAAQQERP